MFVCVHACVRVLPNHMKTLPWTAVATTDKMIESHECFGGCTSFAPQGHCCSSLVSTVDLPYIYEVCNRAAPDKIFESHNVVALLCVTSSFVRAVALAPGAAGTDGSWLYLDEAVEQIGAILDVDIDVREQLAQTDENLVEVRQDVSSRHLRATESRPRKIDKPKATRPNQPVLRRKRARAVFCDTASRKTCVCADRVRVRVRVTDDATENEKKKQGRERERAARCNEAWWLDIAEMCRCLAKNGWVKVGCY